MTFSLAWQRDTKTGELREQAVVDAPRAGSRQCSVSRQPSVLLFHCIVHLIAVPLPFYFIPRISS